MPWCPFDRAARDGSPPITHGYATTAHAAQGATVAQAFVLAGDAIYREWLYVALSRARGNTTLVSPDMGATGKQQLDRLTELVTRTRAQTMAPPPLRAHVFPANPLGSCCASTTHAWTPRTART